MAQNFKLLVCHNASRVFLWMSYSSKHFELQLLSNFPWTEWLLPSLLDRDLDQWQPSNTNSSRRTFEGEMVGQMAPDQARLRVGCPTTFLPLISMTNYSPSYCPIFMTATLCMTYFIPVFGASFTLTFRLFSSRQFTTHASLVNSVVRSGHGPPFLKNEAKGLTFASDLKLAEVVAKPTSAA
ncbi:hypothetical protein K438DRAFT_1765892 [Mycena galopus ATCC 62051]|nr:hypothetical protein K438DRAFT_1765892 [Mycena galopus ATCC 62051]